MVFNCRQMKVADLQIWGAGGGIALFAAFGAAFGGGAAAMSFAAAAAAVWLPQAAMLFFARDCPPQNAFSLWAGKFSTTILLLAGGARFLHSGGMFAAEYFVAGVVAAAAWGAFRAARTAY